MKKEIFSGIGGLINVGLITVCIVFTINGSFRLALISYAGFFLMQCAAATVIGQWINTEKESGGIPSRLITSAIFLFVALGGDWIIKFGGLYSLTMGEITASLPALAWISGAAMSLVGMHRSDYQHN